MFKLAFVLLTLLASAHLKSVEFDDGRIDRSQSKTASHLLLARHNHKNDDIDAPRSQREFVYRAPIEKSIHKSSKEFVPREITKRCNPTVRKEKSSLTDNADSLYRLIDLLNEERNAQKNLNRRRAYASPYPGSADRIIEESDDRMTGSTIPENVEYENNLENVARKMTLADRKDRQRPRECDHKKMICYCQEEDCVNSDGKRLVGIPVAKQPLITRKNRPQKKIIGKSKLKPTKGSYFADQDDSLQRLPIFLPVAPNGQRLNRLNGMQYVPIHEMPRTVDLTTVREADEQPVKYDIPFALSHPERPGYLVGSVQLMSQDRQQGKTSGVPITQARKKCPGNKSKSDGKAVHDEQWTEENARSSFGKEGQDSRPRELFDFDECMKLYGRDVCVIAKDRITTANPTLEDGQHYDTSAYPGVVGVTRNYEDTEHGEDGSDDVHEVTYYGHNDLAAGGIKHESSSPRWETEENSYAPYHGSYEEATRSTYAGNRGSSSGYEVSEPSADSVNLPKLPYNEWAAGSTNYANDYTAYKSHPNIEHSILYDSGKIYSNLNEENKNIYAQAPVRSRGYGKEIEVPENDRNGNWDSGSQTTNSDIQEVTNAYFTSRAYENETNLTGMDADGNKIANYNELHANGPADQVKSSNTNAEIPNYVANPNKVMSTHYDTQNTIIEDGSTPTGAAKYSPTSHDSVLVQNLVKKAINDIALNRSPAEITDAMQIKMLQERLHPDIINIPTLRKIVLSAPMERTIINRVRSDMSKLTGAPTEHLPVEVIRECLQNTIDALPGREPKFRHATIEERQMNQGNWAPSTVTLVSYDHSNEHVEPSTRLRERITHFLNYPTTNREIAHHPVVKNMIVETVKNEMQGETGKNAESTIRKLLDNMLRRKQEDSTGMEEFVTEPGMVQESMTVEDNWRPTTEVNGNSGIVEMSRRGESKKASGTENEEIGVSRVDQAGYKTTSYEHGHVDATTEFPSSLRNFGSQSSTVASIDSVGSTSAKTFDDGESGIRTIQTAPVHFPLNDQYLRIYSGTTENVNLEDSTNLESGKKADEKERIRPIQTAPVHFPLNDQYPGIYSATTENVNLGDSTNLEIGKKADEKEGIRPIQTAPVHFPLNDQYPGIYSATTENVNLGDSTNLEIGKTADEKEGIRPIQTAPVHFPLNDQYLRIYSATTENVNLEDSTNLESGKKADVKERIRPIQTAPVHFPLNDQYLGIYSGTTENVNLEDSTNLESDKKADVKEGIRTIQTAPVHFPRPESYSSTTTVTSKNSPDEQGMDTTTSYYTTSQNSDKMSTTSANFDSVNLGATQAPYNEAEQVQTIQTAPIKYYSPEGRVLEYVKTHSSTAENEGTEALPKDSPTLAEKLPEPSNSASLHQVTVETARAVAKAKTLADEIAQSEAILASKEKGRTLPNSAQTSENNENVEALSGAPSTNDGADKDSAFTENATAERSRYEVTTKTTEPTTNERDEEKFSTIYYSPANRENKQLDNAVSESPGKKLDVDGRVYVTDSEGPSTESNNEPRANIRENETITGTEATAASGKAESVENYTPSSETVAEGGYGESRIYDEGNRNVLTERPVVREDEVSAKTEASSVRSYQERFTTVNYIPKERVVNKQTGNWVGGRMEDQLNMNERTRATDSENIYHTSPSTERRVTESDGQWTEVQKKEGGVIETTTPISEINARIESRNREQLISDERNKYAQTPSERAAYEASLNTHPSTIPHYQERLTTVYYTPKKQLPGNSVGKAKNVEAGIAGDADASDVRKKTYETKFENMYYTTPSVGKAKLADSTILADTKVTNEPEEREEESATIIVKNFTPNFESTTAAQDVPRESSVYEERITQSPITMTSRDENVPKTYEQKFYELGSNEKQLPTAYSSTTERGYKIVEIYPSSTSEVKNQKPENSYYTNSPHEKTRVPLVVLSSQTETRPEIEEMTHTERILTEEMKTRTEDVQNFTPTERSSQTERSIEEASRRPMNYNEMYKDSLVVGRSQIEATERTLPSEPGTSYQGTVYYTATDKVSDNRVPESVQTEIARSSTATQHKTYSDGTYQTSPAYVVRDEIRVTEKPPMDRTEIEPEKRIVTEEKRIKPEISENCTPVPESRMSIQEQTEKSIISEEKITLTPSIDESETKNVGRMQDSEVRKADETLPIVYYSPTERAYKIVENVATDATGPVTERPDSLSYTIREMVNKANAANAYRTTVSTVTEASGIASTDEEVKPADETLTATKITEKTAPTVESRTLIQEQTEGPPIFNEKVTDATFAVKNTDDNLATTRVPQIIDDTTIIHENEAPVAHFSPTERTSKFLENRKGTTDQESTANLKDAATEIMYTSDYDRRYTNPSFENTNFPYVTVSDEKDAAGIRSKVDQVPRVQTVSPAFEHSVSTSERSTLIQESKAPVSLDSAKSTVYYSPIEEQGTTVNPLNTEYKMQETTHDLSDLREAAKKGEVYYATTFSERSSTPSIVQTEKEATEVEQSQKDIITDDGMEKVTIQNSTPISKTGTLMNERSRESSIYDKGMTETVFTQTSAKPRYEVLSATKAPETVYQSSATYEDKAPVTYYSPTERALEYEENVPSKNKNVETEIIEGLPGEIKGKVYNTHSDSVYQTGSPVQKAKGPLLNTSEHKKFTETAPEIDEVTQTEVFMTPKSNTVSTQNPTSNSDNNEERNRNIMTDSPIVAETRTPELNEKLADDLNERNFQLVTGQYIESTTEPEALTKDNFGYFGRISPANKERPPKELSELESSDLYYIGDGVKLPLEIRRLKDGSYALSISSKACSNIIKKECPCCVPLNGSVVRAKRNIRGKRSSRNNLEFAMPVASFAKEYNLALNLDENLEQRRINSENELLDGNDKIENSDITGRLPYVKEILETVEEHGSGESMEDDITTYRYDVNNPLLGRSRFVKKMQDEYEENDDRTDPGYYADRMDDMRNFLLWLKKLILSSD